jgi:hypothetical protein
MKAGAGGVYWNYNTPGKTHHTVTMYRFSAR